MSQSQLQPPDPEGADVEEIVTTAIAEHSFATREVRRVRVDRRARCRVWRLNTDEHGSD